MSINGLFYDLRAQKAKNYRAWMKTLIPDGIINGCALSFTGTSITVGVGHFSACGAVTEIDVAETTDLLDPIASGYVRLKYAIDLTQIPDSVTFTQGSFTYDYSATLGGFGALTQEDINAAGTTYEIEFAIYTMVGSAVTALTRSVGYSSTPNIIEPTFTNSWVNYGGSYETAGYWKDQNNIVHLKGFIKNGTIGAAAFTLPVGYRPSAIASFSIVSNAAFGGLNIASNGAVTVAIGNNANASLSGITFRAEA